LKVAKRTKAKEPFDEEGGGRIRELTKQSLRQSDGEKKESLERRKVIVGRKKKNKEERGPGHLPNT